MSPFYNFLLFLVKIYLKIFFRFKVEGIEKIDYSKSLVVAPNHKTLFDPLIVSAGFSKPIYWMAKKELWDASKLLGKFLDWVGAFPVDRQGTDIRAIRTSIKHLRDNKIVGIFPEGTRKDTFDEASGKNGVALIATRTNSIIVPVYIKRERKIFKKITLIIRNPISYDQKKYNEEEMNEMTRSLMLTIYGGERSIGS